MTRRKAASSFSARLSGGDPRTLAGVRQLVTDVRSAAALEAVVDAMFAQDAIVRMRAADAAEKISRSHPQWLQPQRQRLLSLLGTAQPSLRWHLAQMLPRLRLDRDDWRRVVSRLWRWTKDESRIVMTSSAEALVELSRRDAGLRTRIVRLLSRWQRSDVPSLRA